MDRERAHQDPPSGVQYEITAGAHRAVVTEVGATLRAYELGGRAVVDGFGEGEMCTAARGQPLVPWPNRIRDGRYTFAGREHQAALDEPERRNAIHGLVRWSTFACAARAAARVVLEHTLHPSPGYPFALAVALTYQLDAQRGLAVEVRATNAGREPCPFGAGAHPYLTLGAPTIDAAALALPAATYLLADERQIPVGKAPVGGTPYDFRAARALGGTAFDTCFTDLARDADGRARVVLADARGAPRVTLWMDAAFTHVMLYSGDGLPDVAARRRGLAVEPMTCPPDAFRSGEGLRVLAPGETFAAQWGITPE